MRASEIMALLEQAAPLALQDSYDNAGLQVGLPSTEVSAVLVCLDVTEAIVDEAIEKGCEMIVSHHPLIFRPLKHVSDDSYQGRCVMKAIQHGIAIYSAHTNLDNAEGGVNYKIASLLGLSELSWLQPKGVIAGRESGSGVVGLLASDEAEEDFLARLKATFGVSCLLHGASRGRRIRKVALCGGAGGFLLGDAIAAGADCFITGELHYHDYFGHEEWVEGPDGILLVEMGHYESEQYTKDLLRDILSAASPLRVEMTSLDTNPIKYL